MPRKSIPQKRQTIPDAVYNSSLVTQLINKVLRDGKKSLSQKICYLAMRNVANISNSEPLQILLTAIKNATPLVEVRAKRVGGTILQLPIEIGERRGNSLAIKFLVDSARTRPGKNIVIKLQNEIIDASNNIGNSVKKKEDLHKKAESSKSLGNIKR
jgi:small subunit ribosomal protein S7